MYIPQFWIGVAFTLFAEMLLLIIYSLYIYAKGRSCDEATKEID